MCYDVEMHNSVLWELLETYIFVMSNKKRNLKGLQTLQRYNDLKGWRLHIHVMMWICVTAFSGSYYKHISLWCQIKSVTSRDCTSSTKLQWSERIKVAFTYVNVEMRNSILWELLETREKEYKDDTNTATLKWCNCILFL